MMYPQKILSSPLVIIQFVGVHYLHKGERGKEMEMNQMFKVEQVREPHLHLQLGMTAKVIKTQTVTADQVSATRAAFRQDMRRDPAQGSDVIRVTEA